MGDQPSPSQPPTRPSVPWRVRHSPMTSGVAMLLFLVPAALWLLAASSAQVGVHSGPPGMGYPSLTPFHIWCVIGIVGAVLALGALLQVGWTLAEQRDWTQPGVRHRLLGVVVVASAGVTVEFLLLHFVTAHELAIAPYFQSGEGAVAIAVLAIGQPVLVAALALLCNRLLPVRRPERHHSTLRPSAWIGMLRHRRDGAHLRGHCSLGRPQRDPPGHPSELPRRHQGQQELRCVVAGLVRGDGGSHRRGSRLRTRHHLASRPRCRTGRAAYERG